MKKSLKNKILILSLATLVIAGTGCERRGRAPLKVAPTSGSTNPDGGTTVVAPTGAKPASNTPAEETLTEEGKLLKAAEINCTNIPSGLENLINTSEPATTETMKKDIASMGALRLCLSGDENLKLKTFGVNAKEDGKIDPSDNATFVKTWSIDEGALKAAFDVIAGTPGKTDSDAELVMKSRLQVLEKNANKMLDKYTDCNLQKDVFNTLQGKDITVGDALENFPKIIAAAQAAERLIAGYRTGVETQNPTPSEVSAADINTARLIGTHIAQ